MKKNKYTIHESNPNPEYIPPMWWNNMTPMPKDVLYEGVPLNLLYNIIDHMLEEIKQFREQGNLKDKDYLYYKMVALELSERCIESLSKYGEIIIDVEENDV